MAAFPLLRLSEILFFTSEAFEQGEKNSFKEYIAFVDQKLPDALQQTKNS